ncbi:MAG: carboxylesterase family protein [Thermonemataceae bacterium]|nr:carboxylesterase family protein [Thermonemataceae bacterium]
MKKLYLNFFIGLILLVAVFSKIFAQPLPNRYKTEIFTNAQIAVTNNVAFSTNIPHVSTTNLFGIQFANENTYGDEQVTLRMNIYQPNSTDTLTERPVLIFCFGGGFVTGSKTEASMLQLCQAFAKRGFVTATIDYRLGMNITDEELSKRAVYRGLQDGRSAVRFFRNNAQNYKIDTNQIFIAGHSAGGFIALHNIYLDKDSERPTSTRNYMGRADLGDLDGIGDNKVDTQGNPISGKANAAMGFAGALGELSYIEGATDAPGLYFHSSDDNVIPYTSGEPFSDLNWIPGFNLPDVYGGNALNTRANTTTATHNFYPYNNRGHDVHFDGTNIYTDIAPRGSDFFYDVRLKPTTTTLDGGEVLCSDNLTETYSLSNNTNFYYDWQVTGGTINTSNYAYQSSISITWNPAAPTHSITCTPYSRWLARAMTPLSKNITINQIPLVADVLNNQIYQITDSNPTIDLSSAFSDPENQVMSYTASVSPAGVVSPNMLGATLNLQILGAGTTTVIVTATDAANCSISQSFQVIVNRPPTPTQSISNQTIRYADSPFIIANVADYFTDPDGDALTYSVNTSPSNMVIVTQNVNEYIFSPNDIGSTTVTMQADDNRGGISSLTFVITVEKGTQVITFEPITTKFVDESPVQLQASSNRGLAVNFELVEGEASISTDKVLFEQAGRITIRATQEGNYYFEAANSVEQSFEVIKREQVITFEPIADQILTAKRVNLTVSASSALPVSLEIIEGKATLTDKTLFFSEKGFITVRATQEGNYIYNSAEPIEKRFFVAPEQLEVQLSPNPFQDRIKIDLQGAYLGELYINMYDNLGRQIKRMSIDKNNLYTTKEIIVPFLSSSVYYLVIISPERTFVEKMIKN